MPDLFPGSRNTEINKTRKVTLKGIIFQYFQSKSPNQPQSKKLKVKLYPILIFPH